MKEFTVLLLAGGTSRLSTELSLPKSLLPVGNRPLIWYSLQIIQSNPVLSTSDLLILTSKSSSEPLHAYLTGLKVNYKLMVTDDEDRTTKARSSLEAIRRASTMIRTKSVCVFTVDLFGKIDVTAMINRFRVRNSSLMCLLLRGSIRDPSVQPGQKSRVGHEFEFYTIDEDKGKIVAMARKSDFDEQLRLHESVVNKSVRSRVCADLTDAHFYLIDKVLLELAARSNDGSLRKDFLPKLIRQGSSVRSSPPFDRPTGPIDVDFQLAEPTLMRVKHVHHYFEANRQSPSIVKFYTGEDIHYRDRSESIQVSQDSVVADGIELGKRTTVKSSFIGKHCRIEDKSKVTNSIILDNVLIKEGTVVHNSLIGLQSTIGPKSEIINSIISRNQNINGSSKISNETISSTGHQSDLFQLDDDQQLDA